jgi:hypothetical protein
MTQPHAGREFFKLSGSGNDFVFFDARLEPAGDLAQPPPEGTATTTTLRR